MPRRVRWAGRFLSLLCAALMVAGACFAQDPGATSRPSSGTVPRTFAIRGSLRWSSNNQPAEMIRVQLKKFTGETVNIAFTRSNGEFEFGGLTNGQYLIVIEEQGYEPIQENIEIMNTSRLGIFLFLRQPMAPVGEPPGGGMVTARELALPSKAQEALLKGRRQLYEKKDPAGSLKHFQKLAKEAPDFYEAHYFMGMAYLELGRMQESETALRKAVEMSAEGYAQSYFGLASFYSANNRFAEAVSVARKGIELDPESWQGHYELARALVGLNQLNEALVCLKVVREKRADFPDQYLLSANIYIRRHDPYPLVEALDNYLRLVPSGLTSDQVRETRKSVVDTMARAGMKPPPAPPKP